MRRGFTLVELLIVIVVIAVLAAVAIPKFQQRTQEAREAQAKADLHILRAAFDRARMDTGVYPPNIASIASATAPTTGRIHSGGSWRTVAMPAGWQGPYIHKTPDCPLAGYDYVMRRRSTGQIEIRIRSDGEGDGDEEEAGNPYSQW